MNTDVNVDVSVAVDTEVDVDADLDIDKVQYEERNTNTEMQICKQRFGYKSQQGTCSASNAVRCTSPASDP